MRAIIQREGTLFLKVHFLLYLFMLVPMGVSGSTILEIEFEELCTASELVIEGRVVFRKSRLDQDSGMIWSSVTFEIDEVIAGSYSEQTLRLEYLGGTHGGKTLKIGESRVPDIGERGIYFVRNRQQALVHPLTGWMQGHFIIESDSTGVDRVTTAGRMSVTDIDLLARGASSRISSGVAKGVRTGELLSNERRNVMRKNEFKSMIRTVRATTK